MGVTPTIRTPRGQKPRRKSLTFLDDHTLPIRQIVLVAKEIDRTLGPFSHETDRQECVKIACARLHLRYDSGLIHAALTRLDEETRRRRRKSNVRSAHVPDVGDAPQPLTRDEAADILARLRAKCQVTGAKTMPAVRLFTAHQADRVRAVQMVAREITASIARCDALEQAITDPPALAAVDPVDGGVAPDPRAEESSS